MEISRRRRVPVMSVLVGLMAMTLLVPPALAGGAPSIVASPSSHDYGTIDAGTTATQAFTFTNGGGSATGAMVASLSGSFRFSITADTCTGASLGPKRSCSVTVQYAPTAEGENKTGTLTVASKKPAAVASVSLAGKSTPGEFQFQIDCEQYGGTFSTDPATDHNNTGATTLWTCDGWAATDAPDYLDKDTPLLVDCFPAPGFVSPAPADFPATVDTTCF